MGDGRGKREEGSNYPTPYTLELFEEMEEGRWKQLPYTLELFEEMEEGRWKMEATTLHPVPFKEMEEKEKRR